MHTGTPIKIYKSVVPVARKSENYAAATSLDLGEKIEQYKSQISTMMRCTCSRVDAPTVYWPDIASS